jgi:hypothetical protein
MESTLLSSFLKGANLRRWLTRPDCPSVFKEIKCIFDKIYKPKRSDDPEGDQANTDKPTSTRSIPEDLRHMLKTVKNAVFLRAWINHHGTTYSSAVTHLGNSLIHFYPNGNRNSPFVPGCIKYIYSLDGTNYTFAVQRQLPVDSDFHDPFACYPHFPAKTYSTLLSPSLEYVEADWIFCHFAQWIFSPEHVVILSLSRVSALISLPIKIMISLCYRSDCAPYGIYKNCWCYIFDTCKDCTI